MQYIRLLASRRGEGEGVDAVGRSLRLQEFGTFSGFCLGTASSAHPTDISYIRYGERLAEAASWELRGFSSVDGVCVYVGVSGR